jgi:hypothetical protein
MSVAVWDFRADRIVGRVSRSLAPNNVFVVRPQRLA